MCRALTNGAATHHVYMREVRAAGCYGTYSN